MPEQIQASDTRALLEKFFSLDDLQDLTSDAGTLLGCPILVVDDAFHVSSHFDPLGFSDTLFRTAVNNGEISYEAGAMLSRSEALTAGRADFLPGICRTLLYFSISSSMNGSTCLNTVPARP